MRKCLSCALNIAFQLTYCHVKSGKKPLSLLRFYVFCGHLIVLSDRGLYQMTATSAGLAACCLGRRVSARLVFFLMLVGRLWGSAGR